MEGMQPPPARPGRRRFEAPTVTFEEAIAADRPQDERVDKAWQRVKGTEFAQRGLITREKVKAALMVVDEKRLSQRSIRVLKGEVRSITEGKLNQAVIVTPNAAYVSFKGVVKKVEEGGIKSVHHALGVEGEGELLTVEKVVRNAKAFASVRKGVELSRVAAKASTEGLVVPKTEVMTDYQAKRGSQARLSLIEELMEGGDLFALADDPKVGAQDRLDLLKQTTKGIALLHKLDIVDRDIKPENILLTKDKKQVRLADFDTSKREADIKEGDIEGAANYIPWQIEGISEIDLQDERPILGFKEGTSTLDYKDSRPNINKTGIIKQSKATDIYALGVTIEGVMLWSGLESDQWPTAAQKKIESLIARAKDWQNPNQPTADEIAAELDAIRDSL